MTTFNDRFKTKLSRQRLSQRDIIPTGIRERQWLEGSLYSFAAADTYSDILSLGNGEDNQITIAWYHNRESDLIIPEPYTSIYVSSSVESAAYELPGGGSITESDWLWMPFTWNYDRYKNTYSKRRWYSVGKIWVRNLTAGAAQKVTIVIQPKYQAFGGIS